MNNRKWVENTILGVIVLNIFVMAFVFLIPRMQFMASHWGWEAEALMESSGALDTPNQYSKTYKVVNQIRKIAPDESIIFMPVNNEGFELSRSVVIQRLYPRKVYFSSDAGFGQVLSQVNSYQEVYAVLNDRRKKEYCVIDSMKPLSSSDFGICRIDKVNLEQLLKLL